MQDVHRLSTTLLLAITATATATLASSRATAESLDVTGMRAIYDALTGGIRFEGLIDIHGIGIGRTPEVHFNPQQATVAGTFSTASDEEIGWLFLDGLEGGTFDAGAIFQPGLGAELSQYWIGVSRMGSGQEVTPIPIMLGADSYMPTFNPLAPAPIQSAPAPDLPPQPIFNPPIAAPPNPTGVRAIYDEVTGGLRLDGLQSNHGLSIGIGRTNAVKLNPGGANLAGTFSIANDDEIGWIFLDGISTDSFDAGTVLQPGLGIDLSQYWVGVGSIGSGQNPTPIPIVSGDATYWPVFDPLQAAAPEPIVGLDPVIVPGPIAPDPSALPESIIPPLVILEPAPTSIEDPTLPPQPPDGEFPIIDGSLDPVEQPSFPIVDILPLEWFPGDIDIMYWTDYSLTFDGVPGVNFTTLAYQHDDLEFVGNEAIVRIQSFKVSIDATDGTLDGTVLSASSLRNGADAISLFANESAMRLSSETGHENRPVPEPLDSTMCAVLSMALWVAARSRR